MLLPAFVVVILLLQQSVAWSPRALPLHQVQHSRSPAVRPLTRKTFLKDMPSGQQAEASANNSLQQEAPRIPSSNSGGEVSIRSIQKYARLPVWPAWNGVLIFLVNRLFGDAAAARLENAIGGRVAPNFFQDDESSPFIMLVHHCHSFFAWDILRHFQKRFILPEGFPAHPHRGFITLTYFMHGGFQHRDSCGVQQVYGSVDDGYEHHSQWLFTGAGMLHEEMYDFSKNKKWWQRQELYQLWINVPARYKMDAPQSWLLGSSKDDGIVTPTVETTGGVSTLVLAGTYQGQSGFTTDQLPDLAVFHVQCPPGQVWTYEALSNQETMIVYVRQGAGKVVGSGQEQDLPTHHTAHLQKPFRQGGQLKIRSTGKDPLDFFFLVGAPLREPISAQGSMVMNTPDEIDRAYRDYQFGSMGYPWSHEMSNEEWQAHVAKHPCQYRYSDEKKT